MTYSRFPGTWWRYVIGAIASATGTCLLGVKRSNIDIDFVYRNQIAVELEHIDKWQSQFGIIVSSIGNFAFADQRFIIEQCIFQLVPGACDTGKETIDRSANGVMPAQLRR